MHKIVSKTTCPPEFSKQCPVVWDSLDKLPDSADRWCSICKKQVYRTDDPEKIEELAQDGKCVAVLYKESMLLGSIMPSPNDRKPDRGFLHDGPMP